MDWYEEAVEDLGEASDALSRGRFNWAVFAAHQAVEKALKACIMVVARRLPPKTHDLTELYGLIKSELGLNAESEELLALLSPYYTLAMYPNAGLRRPSKSITQGFASNAVNLASKVVRRVGEVAGFRGEP